MESEPESKKKEQKKEEEKRGGGVGERTRVGRVKWEVKKRKKWVGALVLFLWKCWPNSI